MGTPQQDSNILSQIRDIIVSNHELKSHVNDIVTVRDFFGNVDCIELLLGGRSMLLFFLKKKNVRRDRKLNYEIYVRDEEKKYQSNYRGEVSIGDLEWLVNIFIGNIVTNKENNQLTNTHFSTSNLGQGISKNNILEEGCFWEKRRVTLHKTILIARICDFSCKVLVKDIIEKNEHCNYSGKEKIVYILCTEINDRITVEKVIIDTKEKSTENSLKNKLVDFCILAADYYGDAFPGIFKQVNEFLSAIFENDNFII